MEEFSWPDEILANVSAHVHRFGYALMFIGGECAMPGCPGDHPSDLDELDLPPYGYTAGLQATFEHPELVMVGAGRDRTMSVIDAAATAIADGARFAPGAVLEHDGVSMKLDECAPSWVHRGIITVSIEYHMALGFTGGPSPLQIMWPDERGRFPGDPARSRRSERAQPWLGRHRDRDR